MKQRTLCFGKHEPRQGQLSPVWVCYMKVESNTTKGVQNHGVRCGSEVAKHILLRTNVRSCIGCESVPIP